MLFQPKLEGFEELRFLRHMAEEEEELISMLQSSNQYLETSYQGLVANAQLLNKVHTDARLDFYLTTRPLWRISGAPFADLF